MKQINTGKAELLFIKHNFGDHPFILTKDIDPETEEVFPLLYCKALGTFIELPEANWSEPYNPFDFTEEQWKDILPNYECAIRGYLDYTTGRPDILLKTATESGLSLLITNKVYRENPYGEYPKEPCLDHNSCSWLSPSEKYNEYLDMCNEWEALEENVGNWICLIKVKEE